MALLLAYFAGGEVKKKKERKEEKKREIKEQILCSVIFFENRAVSEIKWENAVHPARSRMTI